MVYIVVVNVFDINRKAMKMCKLLSNVKSFKRYDRGRIWKKLEVFDLQGCPRGTYLALKMGLTRCPEMSVANYPSTLNNVAEDQRRQTQTNKPTT
jgi:hypothetical protein